MDFQQIFDLLDQMLDNAKALRHTINGERYIPVRQIERKCSITVHNSNIKPSLDDDFPYQHLDDPRINDLHLTHKFGRKPF